MKTEIRISLIGFPKSLSVDLFHTLVRLPFHFKFQQVMSENEIVDIHSLPLEIADLYLIFSSHFKGGIQTQIACLQDKNIDAEIIGFSLRLDFEMCIDGYRHGISDLLSLPIDQNTLIQGVSKACKKVLMRKQSQEYLNVVQYINYYTELSNKDDVTGLFNQRKLHHDLSTIVSEHQKTKQEFSVIFIDVDHFKNVNDEFGHIIGSRLLSDVATIIKSCVRDNDLIYRYGGDEFIVIFKNQHHDKNFEVASRILKKIKESIFIINEDKSHRLSVSIGFAHFPKDAKSKEDILNIADRMMYTAKKSGRGRICSAEELLK